MTHRLRTVVPASFLVLAVLVLVACGGGKKKTTAALGACASGQQASTAAGTNSPAALALLRDTFSGSHTMRSANLVAQLSATLQGIPSASGPILLKLSGPFDRLDPKLPPKFDFALSVALGGKAFKAGIVTDGSGLVIKIKDDAYAVPDSLYQRFAQGSTSKSGSGSSSNPLSELGIQPLKLIKNATVAGDEQIAGEPTSHVTAQLDVAGLLDTISGLLSKVPKLGVGTTQLPQGITASQRAAVTSAIKTATIDVCSGKTDHALRKLDISTLVVPPAGSAGPLQQADLKLQVQFSDINEPQSVTLPTDTKPLAQLQQQIQGLLSGLGGLGGSGVQGSGATSSGSGSSTPPASAVKAQQLIQKCVEEANGDGTKLGKCLKLVPKG